MIPSIGGFSRQAELGKGATGDVWVGVKDGVSRAIKTIRPELPVPLFGDALRKMMDEGETLVHIAHPNIVKLCEANIIPEKEMYLAFELLRKETLFDVLLENKGLPEDVARHCFVVILEALEHVHAKGYAHRDIKPENILLDAEFSPKLADFGLACRITPSGRERLVQGDVGTLGYKAPEVEKMAKAKGKKGYDGIMSDIFSLGIVLLHMVTGRLPFNRTSKEDTNYREFCSTPGTFFLKMAALNPHRAISPECQKLLQSLLAEDPKKRLSILKIKATSWFHGPQRTLKEFVTEQRLAVPPPAPAK
jgi:serine/threonine protein kinase